VNKHRNVDSRRTGLNTGCVVRVTELPFLADVEEAKSSTKRESVV
jgi:hypothetical protein